MPDLKQQVENFIKTGDPDESDSRDWPDMIPFEWAMDWRQKDYVAELETFLFKISKELEKSG